MDRWMSLALGGIIGVFARYLLATWVYSAAGTAFPYGTLIVNVSGCLLIGIFESWAGARGILSPVARLFLMTGFCGAYTTFSTLILETSNLVNDGQLTRALANYLGSGVFGFVLFRLGELFGRVI